MGFCTGRHILLSICLLQLISTIERQVFDFLGYMWIPILVNFFEIIFVIFGFFGTFQYRPKYVIAYTIWNFALLAWNIFLICLYLDVGVLRHKESGVLKLDPGSSSWWMTNGPGCHATYNNPTELLLTPDSVTGCLVDYVHVEVFHAAVQCLLALAGFITGICLSKSFMEEDDSSSRSSVRKPSKRTSLYSIEFSPQHETRQADSDGDSGDCLPAPISPKPMTPRRVKRRNVMQRGSGTRHSTSSRRHGVRSSQRSIRGTAQNPVTRIMDRQQQLDSSTSPASSPPIDPPPRYHGTNPNNLLQSNEQRWQVNGHTNPTYQQSSTQSLNQDQEDLDDLYNNRPASVRSSYSNFHGTRAISYGAPAHYYGHGHATPQVPQKRVSNQPHRQSMRSMAFINSGPPAYSSHGRASVDSETTI